MEYSVVVVTRLGPGLARESQLQGVTAPRNLSRLPYQVWGPPPAPPLPQLVGFSLEQEEYVMVELTVCSLVIVGLAVSITIFLLSQVLALPRPSLLLQTLPVYTDNVAQVCFQCSLLR